MALILSIETSTTVCSVALTDNGANLHDLKLYEEQSHSTHLTLLIGDLLSQSKKEMKDLDAIAVSEGPGSYTGLRIGVSTAKGLCYTLGIPLIAVATLKAMAFEVKQKFNGKMSLVPMLDARRMEVYTATYSLDLKEEEELRPLILDETSFNETLKIQTMLFFGNGASKFQALMGRNDKAKFIDGISPSAWAIGQLASTKFEREEFEDVAYFEPNYLKAYQATKPKKLL